MSNITLPRAVVEQVREALLSFDNWWDDEADTALAALDAALEAQEDEALLNEPVAMRYDGDGYGYLYIDSGSGSDWQRRHKDAEPLYTAPPAAATREPATAAEIVKAGGECAVVDDKYLLDFRDGWREAERFHGIGGSKT